MNHNDLLNETMMAFEKRFGGFIVTQAKRDKQDRDNEWLRSRILLHEKAMLEAIDPDEKWHKERGYILRQTSDHEEGWNACREETLKRGQDYLAGNSENV